VLKPRDVIAFSPTRSTLDPRYDLHLNSQTISGEVHIIWKKWNANIEIKHLDCKNSFYDVGPCLAKERCILPLKI
jgi:hypothetical protein